MLSVHLVSQKRENGCGRFSVGVGADIMYYGFDFLERYLVMGLQWPVSFFIARKLPLLLIVLW
jgi:hypothetical protein